MVCAIGAVVLPIWIRRSGADKRLIRVLIEAVSVFKCFVSDISTCETDLVA